MITKLGRWREGAPLIAFAALLLAVAWIVPPVVSTLRRSCPVRPDGTREAGAFALFARRYNTDCDMCHTTVPALTKYGYQFRAQGFRTKEELGKDVNPGYDQLLGARVRERFTVTGVPTDSNAGQNVAAASAFSNPGLGFYSAGSVGKYWAEEAEMDFNNGNSKTTANGTANLGTAYLRGTFPVNENLYFTLRAGLMGALEGYGASDRATTNLSPKSGSTKASQLLANGKTFTSLSLKPSGEGVEVGATWKDTRLSMQVVNGVNNSLGASGTVGEDNQYKDVSVAFNQFIDGERAAVTAFFYSGFAGYLFNGLAETTPPGDWVNHYTREAVYGTLRPMDDERLNLQAGIDHGSDHLLNTTTKDFSNTFNSNGWFGRVQSKFNEHLTGSVTYDWASPSNAASNNHVSDWTFSLAMPYGINKWNLDYQIVKTQNGAAPDSTGHTLLAEWMLFY